LLYTLSKVVSVFLLHLELEFSKGVVDLPKEIHAVSHILEVLVGVEQVPVLLNELLNIHYRLGKVLKSFFKPLLGLVSPFTNDFRHHILNFTDEILRGGKKGGAATLAVDLEQTNLCH